MINLISLKDVYHIAEILAENGYSDKGLTVEINVGTKKNLSRIDSDIFFRTKAEGTPMEDVDEVDMSVYGIDFRYVAKDEDKQGASD